MFFFHVESSLPGLVLRIEVILQGLYNAVITVMINAAIKVMMNVVIVVMINVVILVKELESGETRLV